MSHFIMQRLNEDDLDQSLYCLEGNEVTAQVFLHHSKNLP